MKRALISTLFASLAMAACGGESGNILPGDRQPPPPGAGITTDNATTVVASAWDASNRTASLTGLLTNTGFVASEQNISGGAQLSEPSKSIVEITMQVPIAPPPENCAVSGSVTITGEIADPITPTLTPNDVLRVVVENCDDGLGEVSNGVIDYVVDAFSGDLAGGTYVLTMTMQIDNFSVTSASGTTTADGDATVTLDTSAPNQVFAAVAGLSMTIDTNSSSETLTNYQSTQTLDFTLNPAEYTFSSLGTLDSTQLTGVVDYTTPVTFEGLGAEFPNSGELLVSGANSSARLVALDNTNVRIDVDSNGDGTVDDMISTTWAALCGS
jgi:hypothetical protein